MWQKVSDYSVKLAAQKEKKGRKAKLSSFLGFPPSMPISLSELSCSFDNAVVTTTASSTSVCHVTYAMSSSIVLERLFVLPAVSISGELSWKRKWEGSDSLSVSKEEMAA